MRRWITIAGVVGAVAGALFLPASAFAATCTDLQNTLNAASPGAVIDIDQVYTGCGLTIPAAPHSPVTLRGTVPGAGFDGNVNSLTSIISGIDIGATVFQDLTFKNAHTTSQNGSAVHVDGASAPQFVNDVFLNNTTTLGGGGALNVGVNGSGPVVISGSTFGGLAAGLGNSAATGGAARIIANSQDVQLTGSSFLGNQASGDGGGAYLSTGGALKIDSTTFEGNAAKRIGGGALAFGHSLGINNSTFRSNVINDPVDSNHSRGGGGVYASASAVGGVEQSGNLFDGNTITYTQSTASSVASGGGGEYIFSGAATISGDRFTNNSVTNTSTEPGEGGGLHGEGCASSPGDITPLTLVNAVVAGNSIYAGGEGAGVYVGCAAASVHLQLTDTTVAGNVGAAAIDGGSDDVVALTNSIVTGGAGQSAFSGFAPGGIGGTFSDACLGGGPVAGAGNICADPALVAPEPGTADVHETGTSPTIDAGSNALVPPGLMTDYEGQPRVQGAIVDMGADERAGPPVVPPVVVDTTPPSITGLFASRRVFRVGGRPTPISARRHKAGTRIRYTLSEAATVRFTFKRLVRGRRVHGHCRRRARVGRRCTLALRSGTLTRKAAAGKNSLKFSGRIGRRKLRVGRYRLIVTARDAAGNTSKPRRLGLRIVRR